MLISPQILAENVRAVRARVAAAAAECGRNADSVTIVAASKSQPSAVVQAVARAGLTHFGESYLKEALEKMDAPGAQGITWHFIGQIQSNKTRPVAERFAWVHGIDRPRIAERLSAQRPYHAPPLNVCIQVNLAEERTKGGVPPKEIGALAEAVAALPRLALRGLMCLPPPERELDSQRRWFRELRHLFEQLNDSGAGLDTLSMGMSADFEAAVLEGATLVRIGTALFGPRSRT